MPKPLGDGLPGAGELLFHGGVRQPGEPRVRRPVRVHLDDALRAPLGQVVPGEVPEAPPPVPHVPGVLPPRVVGDHEDQRAEAEVGEHGEGVLGKGGRGIVDHFGLHGKVDIEVGTLSKAFGVVGGLVAGDPTRALLTSTELL